MFTFPNIHLAINFNNPVIFLFAQGVWQLPVLHTEIWSHHHHHPVCLMTWRNRTNEKNCGNVSKMLQETYLQSYSTVKSLRHLCTNSVQWGCCKKNVRKINWIKMWCDHPLRLASFALGALAHSFSGSFAGKSLETSLETLPPFFWI